MKLGALGDAVMASTMIKAAQRRWPRSEITWVAGRSIADLVRLFRGVQRVIEVDERALFHGSSLAKGRTLVGAWRAIGTGYDVALIAHTDTRYRLLAAFSGARDVRRHVSETGGTLHGRWHGASYAELVDAMAGAEASVADVELASLSAPVSSQPTVVIAPGGARNVLRDDPLRRWPVASWQTLTRALIDAGFHVMAVGAPSDAVECGACENAGAENRCGRTSLPELLALLRDARCAVSHDSSVLHLAMLIQTPCVALFGPTRPTDRVPDQASVTVLSAANGLACAPCYDGRSYARCDDNRCLRELSPQAVLEAVQRFLRSGRPGTA